MNVMERTVGDVLREWRQRRHLSQLDLASEAEVSARHLSFVETGRSNPSRDLLLHLADHLRIPLRERNTLLVAGGFAPVYPQRSLQDPGREQVRDTIELILRCHEPNPALAIDRHWNMVSANRMIQPLLYGVRSELLEWPINVLRLSLHPEGLAPRILNAREFGAHLVSRLRHEIDVSGDAELMSLLEEMESYLTTQGLRDGGRGGPAEREFGGLAIPFQLETDAGVLSFLSTTTVFGTATDVALAELAIESFFPFDSFTSDMLRAYEGAMGEAVASGR